MRARTWLEMTGWLGLMIGLAWLGWVMMSATFMTYDDEGYVLYSVRMFCAGHPLYTEVFSQYGPAYYLFYRGIHELTGLVITHDVGRLFTLTYWLASSLALGLLARRLGASRITSWCACLTGYVLLIKNINEPFHPGALIALLTILAAWLGAECVLREKSRWMGLIMGALGTLLVLTKINVGVFLLCAWGSWWLRDSLAGRGAARYAGWALALIVTLFPALLMRSHLDTAWGASFAITFALSALAVGAHIWCQTDSVAPSGLRFDWLWVSLGMVSLIVAIMAALGTTPLALWEGVIAGPMRHPKVYAFPTTTTFWSAGVTALSLCVAFLTTRLTHQPLKTALIVGARVIALGAFAWAATRSAGWTTLPSHVLALGPASAIWLLLPLTEKSGPALRARCWVAWVFLWQSLHAYPVAGSQIGWGTALWVVLAALALEDMRTALRSRWRFAPLLVSALLALVCVQMLRPVVTNARLWWADRLPLEISGASGINPPPAITKALNVLHANLVEEAGIVASLPGMLSFNLWSNRPSPIIANTTHWFTLLNEAQQHAAVAALEADPRAVLVFHRDLINFLAKDGIAPSGPLSNYLRKSFNPVLRVGPYDLCVKNGRTLRGYGTFKERAGIATAWALRTTPPTGLQLRSPTRPDWDGVTLTDATWQEVEPGRWLVTATFPADWPPHLARELLLEGTPAQRLIENHAPVP